VIVMGKRCPRRGAGRAALLCALALGVGLGLVAARHAEAAVRAKPVTAAPHLRATVPKHAKLIVPLSARPRRIVPLGAGRRPGKTITVRTAGRSLPR
jgi:hypothetical protein